MKYWEEELISNAERERDRVTKYRRAEVRPLFFVGFAHARGAEGGGGTLESVYALKNQILSTEQNRPPVAGQLPRPVRGGAVQLRGRCSARRAHALGPRRRASAASEGRTFPHSFAHGVLWSCPSGSVSESGKSPSCHRRGVRPGERREVWEVSPAGGWARRGCPVSWAWAPITKPAISCLSTAGLLDGTCPWTGR